MNKIIIIPLLFSVFFSCTKEQTEQQKIEDVKNAFILNKQQISKKLMLPAELLPYERSELYAKVGGYVNSISRDIGDKVKKGEVLAILEAPEVAAQYAESSARLQEFEAKYSASSDRYRRIARASGQEGVIADTELISARNQLLADSAATVSAKAAAQAFRQLYSYLTIRSPFDGIITKRTIDPGDYVGQPGSNPLFIVEKPEILRLRVYVPETFVNSIPSSEMIPFTTESVVGQQFSAKLARKSGSIDPATRTELWEYEYDNSQMNLKPGMYAIANLQLHRPESTFVVPHAAVATTLERKFVIRIRNSEVEWVDVRQGIADENGMEIFGNLQEGDTILMRATDELKSGSMVKINLSKP